MSSVIQRRDIKFFFRITFISHVSPDCAGCGIDDIPTLRSGLSVGDALTLLNDLGIDDIDDSIVLLLKRMMIRIPKTLPLFNSDFVSGSEIDLKSVLQHGEQELPILNDYLQKEYE